MEEADKKINQYTPRTKKRATTPKIEPIEAIEIVVSKLEEINKVREHITKQADRIEEVMKQPLTIDENSLNELRIEISKLKKIQSSVSDDIRDFKKGQFVDKSYTLTYLIVSGFLILLLMIGTYMYRGKVEEVAKYKSLYYNTQVK